MGWQKKIIQIVRKLFYKAKDEGTDIHKCLMIYCNTPLESTSKSPMQMLQQRSARSQLPMLNAACRQLGIAAEQTTANKNQHLPLHDLHIGQEVMYQDSVTKRWILATIKALCPEPRSYQIQTTKGVIKQENTKSSETIQILPEDSEKQQFNQNNDHKQSLMNQTLVNNSDNLQQSHPKRQIKIPLKLNL